MRKIWGDVPNVVSFGTFSKFVGFFKAIFEAF
jgi:hypothetical protein